MQKNLSKLEDVNDGIHIRKYFHEEDRLSNLPDTLLITILSLLPIDSAAATSVLSHRWRHLWTHITHLSFIFPEKSTFDEYEYFVTTVDHILSQINSPKIHTFKLYFSEKLSAHLRRETRYISGFMVPWIRQICQRNPEVINVRFERVEGNSPTFEVPTSLLETQSLVDLTLFTRCEFKLPVDGVLSFINLPNLKKLDMCVSDPHRVSMRTLFKSCPLLEDLVLSLYMNKGDQLVHISAPNLKHLLLDIVENYSFVDCKFVIDAPKLEHLEVVGFLASYHFVKHPSNLQRVRIYSGVVCFMLDYKYNDKILRLIRGISCTRSLILDYHTGGLLFNHLDGTPLPIFHNLTHLSFTCDFKVDRIPGCFLGSLKTVEILDFDDIEMQLLQHILSNATVLEKLHLTVQHRSSIERIEDKPQMEIEICKELFLLSRSSPSCQIEFSGEMINASSKDFINGVLSCESVG